MKGVVGRFDLLFVRGGERNSKRLKEGRTDRVILNCSVCYDARGAALDTLDTFRGFVSVCYLSKSS